MAHPTRDPHREVTQFARMTSSQARALAAIGADAIGVYIIAQRLPWHLDQRAPRSRKRPPTLAEIAAACRRTTRSMSDVLRPILQLGAITRSRGASRDPWRYAVVDEWMPPGEEEGWLRIPDEWALAVGNGRASVTDLGRVVIAVVMSSPTWWAWHQRRQFCSRTQAVAAILGCTPASVTGSIRCFIRAGLLDRDGHTIRVPEWIAVRTWGKPKREPGSVREVGQTRGTFRPRAEVSTPVLVLGPNEKREKAPYSETPQATQSPHGASPRKRSRPKSELVPLHPMAQDILDRAGLRQWRFADEQERDRYGALAIQVVTRGKRKRQNPTAVVLALVKRGEHPGRDRAVWDGLKRGEQIAFDHCDRRIAHCACGISYGAPDAFGSGYCPSCGTQEGEPCVARDAHPELENALSLATHRATVGKSAVSAAEKRSRLVKFVQCHLQPDQLAALLTHPEVLEEVLDRYATSPQVRWTGEEWAWREEATA